ncbi:PHP domain-containing protein [Nonomuraea rhizosphaerae]|uniref:PHP domain-containing protein n=1 Tax=Nonomuraea rhizosphaerae TaxID=2665663 RepID=UPI001C5D5AE2|nr:PHP domain-containing protein [Nonomuraea rhizosphaerae]
MSSPADAPLLPPDSHVHSEWSWDALAGSMERTCERAVEIGLPSLAFTEHADFTPWSLGDDVEIPDAWRPLVSGKVLTPPALDLDGYRACLERCRERFPALRILSGVELGEPHWHGHGAGELLARGEFDRVLASLHCLPVDGGYADLSNSYGDRSPGTVVRAYLAEVAAMIERFDGFEVLAHVDYPVRYWPVGGEPYEPAAFEDDYRVVLRALAGAGKALEINTRVPLDPVVVRWWYEEGGQAVTFASDAHEPDLVAHGLVEASAMAGACGFRPGAHPYDFWRRA